MNFIMRIALMALKIHIACFLSKSTAFQHVNKVTEMLKLQTFLAIFFFFKNNSVVITKIDYSLKAVVNIPLRNNVILVKIDFQGTVRRRFLDAYMA